MRLYQEFRKIMRDERIPLIENHLEWLVKDMFADDMVEFLNRHLLKYLEIFNRKEKYKGSCAAYSRILYKLVESWKLKDYRDGII